MVIQLWCDILLLLLLLLFFGSRNKAKLMTQQNNCYIGHSSGSCPQTLFNSANFQNGTILKLQHSLAALSALVKRCLMDQAVPSLFISVLCPFCVSLSQTVLIWAALGYRSTAKTLPPVTMLCQCYYLCACGSIIVRMLDVKNVLWALCVFRSVYMWWLIVCALVPALSAIHVRRLGCIRFQVGIIL